MTWYDHADRTKPVIDPRTQIASKYPDMEIPELPPRAVVFCLGKGLPVLKEHFPCRPVMEKLPGFITHSEVLGIEGVSGLCFLHGGYASPQIACTIETLHVLGVKEVYLVGLCGGFAGHLSVGDILLPERIRSEEGIAKLKTVTHFHYNVPVMVLVCYDMREVWTNPGDRYYRNYNSGEQDASIAATTMMYEAEELGVHTIWIRGFDSKTVVDTFGIPEHMIPVMMLGLGYPNERTKANAWHYKRKPIEDFVTEL